MLRCLMKRLGMVDLGDQVGGLGSLMLDAGDGFLVSTEEAL